MSLATPTGVHPHPSSPEPSRAEAKARRASLAAHASGRRRGVDPATCDRDYSGAELEFMNAMQAYKVRSGRLFPTWSEVLEVVGELGYTRSDESAGQSSPLPQRWSRTCVPAELESM